MKGGKNAHLHKFPEGETELQKHLPVCAFTDPESVWEERFEAKEQELRDFAEANGITEYEIKHDRDAKTRFVYLSAMCHHKIKGMQ